MQLLLIYFDEILLSLFWQYQLKLSDDINFTKRGVSENVSQLKIDYAQYHFQVFSKINFTVSLTEMNENTFEANHLLCAKEMASHSGVFYKKSIIIKKTGQYDFHTWFQQSSMCLCAICIYRNVKLCPVVLSS